MRVMPFLAHLSQRLTGELIVWLASVVVVCSLSAFSNMFSYETTGQIKVKFHAEHPWNGGMEVYLQGPGHMTKLAAMPI